MEKRKVGKVTKILQMLYSWLFAKFYFAFYVLINSSNYFSHILARIYIIFPENVLNKLVGLLKPNSDLRKKSYQVRQNLAPFCNLVVLILGCYCVKGLMVTKFFKKVGIEGAWSELGAKKCS